VAFVWATSRRMPRVVVLIGSVVALAGLVLVVSPGGAGALDPFGVLLAVLAAVGCAIYYVAAARPSDSLPPVAFAAAGLLLGGVGIGVAGLVGAVPFTASFGSAELFGASVPWWVPLLVVGVVATALAYATSISASERLGSRLASFVGMLEVVAAALYAWVLLGENLGIPQILGGVLILGGIVFVRAEKRTVPEEPVVPAVFEAPELVGPDGQAPNPGVPRP
jgi:drug/metabolite transporter (DMT)-like permease